MICHTNWNDNFHIIIFIGRKMDTVGFLQRSVGSKDDFLSLYNVM